MLTPASLKLASQTFLRLAKDTEAKMQPKQDSETGTALRIVAGQCYFYSGIEAIESILLKAGITVEDHRDRIRKMEQNYRLFKNPNDLLTKHKILTQEGLNYRRRVAYRGENGNKFIVLKEFAEVARQEIE